MPFFSVFCYFLCYFDFRCRQKSTYNFIRVITEKSKHRICFPKISNSIWNKKRKIFDISFDFELLSPTAPSTKTYQKPHSGIRAPWWTFWGLQTSVPASFNQTTSRFRTRQDKTSLLWQPKTLQVGMHKLTIYYGMGLQTMTEVHYIYRICTSYT